MRRKRNLLAAPAVLAFGLAACGGGAPEPRLSGLLITLDTTRADALSCYGNARATSPTIDALAAEGILFERAHTSVPITLPAHASMLTGLYPPRHGLRDNGIGTLSPDARTLAELAREGGYQTAAFVGSVVLSDHFGLDQGFDVYTAPRRSLTGQEQHGAERSAREVVDEALEWLAGRDPGRPFLAWLHFYDPHHPYAPPADFDGVGWDDEPYLAEVAYVDGHLDRLLDALRADGTLDETVVLVTADHGEAFGEHGETTHGGFCFEPTMHVPFVLRRPDDPRAGERSRFEAGVVDVLPTMAAALGLDVPAGIDGVDAGAEEPSRPGLYFESYFGYLLYGWSPLAGWLKDDGKYLHSSAPLFFDVGEDPGELTDLLGVREREVRAARVAIAGVFERPALELAAGGADEELLEAIRGLGYAGAGGGEGGLPHPLAPSDLPAPHLRAVFFALSEQARAQELAGDPAGALATFRKILEGNPRNPFAREEVARMLLVTGKPDEAVAALEQLVADAPPQARHFFGLGMALAAAGRAPDSIEPLRKAIAMSQGRPFYVRFLADVLRSLGRQDELDALLEQYP